MCLLSGMVVIGWESATCTTSETKRSVELFAILMNPPLKREVVVTATTSDGTASKYNRSLIIAWSSQYISAVAGSDYNAVSVELTFVPGQTRLSVIVGIIKDDACEQPNEIFTGVLINTLSDPLLMVTPNVTTVTFDDELEPECR